MARRVAAVLAMSVVQVGFAGYFVLCREAFTHAVSPLLFALLRDAGGALCLTATAWRLEGRPRVQARHIGLFALCGVCGVYFGQLMPAVALGHITANNVALLQPAQPVATFAIALGLGMETFHWRRLSGVSKVAGLLASVAGAVVIIALSSASATADDESLGDKQPTTRDLVIGNAIIIAQVMAGGVFLCGQKVLLRTYTPLMTAAMCYAFGCGFVFLGVLPSGVLFEAKTWDLPLMGIVAVLYAIFISSYAGYFILAWANDNTNPAIAVATSTVNPVATALLSATFLNRQLTVADGIGGALVLLGLFGMVLAKVAEWREADAAVAHVDAVRRAHAQGAAPRRKDGTAAERLPLRAGVDGDGGVGSGDTGYGVV